MPFWGRLIWTLMFLSLTAVNAQDSKDNTHSHGGAKTAQPNVGNHV